MLPNRGAGLWSGLSLPSAGHPHSLFKPIFLFYFLTAGFLFLDTPPPHYNSSHLKALVSTGQNSALRPASP